MSDTPRTDALVSLVEIPGAIDPRPVERVPAWLARELEIDLAAAREEIAALQALEMNHEGACVRLKARAERAEAERDALRAQLDIECGGCPTTPTYAELRADLREMARERDALRSDLRKAEQRIMGRY